MHNKTDADDKPRSGKLGEKCKKGSENIYFADIFLSDPETCFKTGWNEMKDLDSRKNENEKDTPTLTIDLDTKP